MNHRLIFCIRFLSFVFAIIALTSCTWVANPQQDRLTVGEIETWKVYLGIALIIQYLFLLYSINHMRRDSQFFRFLWGLLLLPLAWTILGEWVYVAFSWLHGLGLIGLIILVIIFGLQGFSGFSNAFFYVLGAFVYKDLDLLLYTVVPSLVTSSIVVIRQITTPFGIINKEIPGPVVAFWHAFWRQIGIFGLLPIILIAIPAITYGLNGARELARSGAEPIASSLKLIVADEQEWDGRLVQLQATVSANSTKLIYDYWLWKPESREVYYLYDSADSAEATSPQLPVVFGDNVRQGELGQTVSLTGVLHRYSNYIDVPRALKEQKGLNVAPYMLRVGETHNYWLYTGSMILGMLILWFYLWIAISGTRQIRKL